MVFSTEVFDGVPLTIQQSTELQIAFHPFFLRDSISSQSLYWAIHIPECAFSAFTITNYSPELQNAEIYLDSERYYEGAFPTLNIFTHVAAAVFFSICISDLHSAVTRHVVILDNGYLASLLACLTFEPEPLDLRFNTCHNVFKYLTCDQSENQLIEGFLQKIVSMHKLNAEEARNSYHYFLVYLAWEELDLQKGDWDSGLNHLYALEKAAENSEELGRQQALLRLKRLIWRTVTELIRWLQLI